MDNYQIADHLTLLSKLIDIHGGDAFKSKTYASAAFTLEKLTQDVTTLSAEKIFKLRGIGERVGKKVMEIIETGELSQLQELLAKTPEGVLEMMNIKGLGPKKIHTLWKQMNIDNIEDLKTACEENRIAATKGFGEKTQQNILQSISFQQQNAGKYLYAKAEGFALAFTEKLKNKFPEEQFEITGDFRRQMEIIESLDWVTTASSNDLQKYLLNDHAQLITDRDGMLIISAENSLLLRFYLETKSSFAARLFATSADEAFLQMFDNDNQNLSTEEEIFSAAGIHYIPPFLRENKEVVAQAKTNDFSNIINTGSIKGLIHSHSNWSDGAHTIEVMAEELIRLGFEYLVISDHSKAAFYANGLSEQKIIEQHKYVDELNKKLAPFKIFKSIECDILNDGSLDYSNDILSTFDLVITSVHSNLTMTEEKAMHRLMGAITNPYTTILGHMTGRLLLKRKGFPVEYKTIIDACAAQHVAIEINANPRRLDMDWRWIDYALEQGVLLSINPDAHTTDEFHNVKYGVLVAQKGGLIAEKNLSSFSLPQFEAWLAKRRKIEGL